MSAPDETAVAHADGRWSWRELDRRVGDAARRLRGGAREAGARVALVLENGPDAVVLLHGAWRAGLEAAPLSPRLTPRELADALRALSPALVVRGEKAGPDVNDAVRRLEGMSGAPAATPDVVASADMDALPAADGPLEPPPAGAVRAVLWTSGTTGRPRGVLLTDANLRASARGAAVHLDLSPTDRWFASLSVAHVGGLALVTRAAYLGSAVVVRTGFDAAGFLDLAREGAVSHASFVPVMLRRVLDAADGAGAPGGLACLLIGGAPTPAELLERALAGGWPVALTYGQSEASSQVATAPPERVRRKPGSVGRPLDGVEVRIAALPTDGTDASGRDEGNRNRGGGEPDDGEGEIRVRGATVAAGYLGGEPLPLDADGWLRTGDLGRIDGDGDLWVTGRLAERIVTGGVNVDPAEVEAALEEAPDVVEVAVVGVPDPEWGEVVAGAVVPATPISGPGAGARDEVRRRIEAFARERLAGPKRPRRILVLAELPRTPTGKVDRRRLRERFERAGTGEDGSSRNP